MDRLTRRWKEDGGTYESIIVCEENCLNDGQPSCACGPIRDVRRRLAAYEDTGLSPDEITAALSRLAEYEAAEREGRLVRLPCKVGTKYYRTVRRPPYESQYRPHKKEDKCIREGSVSETNCFRIMKDIGKTVFLTREEAATAMKGEGE